MSFRLQNRDALFLDIDGTLLDIARTPDMATVPPGLVDDLAKLYTLLGGALALISGRTIASIDSLFHPLQLPSAGVHGAEWRIGGEYVTTRELPVQVVDSVLEGISSFPGIIMEDKKYALAIHYRNAPQFAGPIKHFLEGAVSGGGDRLSVMCGKMVCEVVDPAFNKGTAVQHFMETHPFSGRRPVFLGDDVSDLSAIKACIQMNGVGIYVGHGQEKDNGFSSPADVRRWLRNQLL